MLLLAGQRLVRQHRFDGGPFIIAEFVAHDSRAPVSELESRLLQRHQPAMAYGDAANGLNLLPLSAEQRTWRDLPLALPRRE
ncbi:MAG: hypothetical protein QOJ86_5055 [Bradyrhizobium sp.]|jgi:hypothetical protein|nr:hypothetical protein [Bradyrhizobium sp.]